MSHRSRLFAWLASLTVLLSLAGCDSTSVVGGLGDASTDLGVDVSCTGTATRCGSVCIDTQTSRENCGACGTACPGAQVCVAGRCAVACPGTQRV